MSSTLEATAARYGVQYTGELVDGSYHEGVDRSQRFTLADLQKAGGRISRLRLLTDPGCPFFDISYCHGKLPNGQIVEIDVNEAGQPRRRSLKGDLIAWAKREGVFAKGLGLLDEGNWAILY